jgi:chorismate mutase
VRVLQRCEASREWVVLQPIADRYSHTLQVWFNYRLFTASAALVILVARQNVICCVAAARDTSNQRIEAHSREEYVYKSAAM